jgi:hypothetical protein
MSFAALMPASQSGERIISMMVGNGTRKSSPFAGDLNDLSINVANGSNEVWYGISRKRELSVCPASERYFN